ncbi:MAG: methylmalonyl-CoA epimerase [Anaerolineae bacterium]|nr:methylmalonyl-CoA epimerase [Anaerolineae bacterium]
MKINHLAVVVHSVEDALLFWRDALGLSFDGIEEVPEEAVKVGFLDANGVHIELLEPTTDDSGVAKYLDKRGPGMHHLCLEVDDLEQAMASLKAKGMQLIYEEPRVRDNGRRYTFVHPKSTGGVMIELYEADKA